LREKRGSVSACFGIKAQRQVLIIAMKKHDRRKVATTLQNPKILKIRFHTLRHWKATMEYHKTKDILYVKELLGHRNINSTLIYTHLINFKGEEYYSATAKTVDEAKDLIEKGFEYVTEMDGVKLFRKRK